VRYPISERDRREFESRYEAQIVPSDRPYRRVRRPTYTEVQSWYAIDPSINAYNDCVETVEMIEICLPRDRLGDLLESQDSFLFAKEDKERRLRQLYPSLSSAWEQYQIVLALVDDHTHN
jgi:hypothetical protein